MLWFSLERSFRTLSFHQFVYPSAKGVEQHSALDGRLRAFRRPLARRNNGPDHRTALADAMPQTAPRFDCETRCGKSPIQANRKRIWEFAAVANAAPSWSTPRAFSVHCVSTYFDIRRFADLARFRSFRSRDLSAEESFLPERTRESV